jgi:hypothetical protein
MPTIRAFCGILGLIFYRDNRQHQFAHIHASYQGEEAVFAISDGTVAFPSSSCHWFMPGWKSTAKSC